MPLTSFLLLAKPFSDLVFEIALSALKQIGGKARVTFIGELDLHPPILRWLSTCDQDVTGIFLPSKHLFQ